MKPPSLNPKGRTAMSTDLNGLTRALRTFAAERDWEPFHTPKNLACALSVESAELLERFQWLTDEQSRMPSPEQREAISQEIGDVLLYLLRLCDVLGVDPLAAAQAKLALNAQKYPAEKARGSARKYTEL